MNNYQAIILALDDLGGEGSIKEVIEWIETNYPNRWKDIRTAMADMVPKSLGGNSSSPVNVQYRVLERVSRGRYRIFSKKKMVI